MNSPLLDQRGRRKYLTPSERKLVIDYALSLKNETGDFCLLLALTGVRISEGLALTWERVDRQNCSIVFETLKRRKPGHFRALPVPKELVDRLNSRVSFKEEPLAESRFWSWSRPTAWRRVKMVMLRAGVGENLCKPRALRHGFAIAAVDRQVPLGLVQRWLGHARVETTLIYTMPVGKEERAFARLTWEVLDEERAQ